MKITLTNVTNPEDWQAYHHIRRTVLFAGRPYDDQHGDEYLLNNHPLLLQDHGKPLGVARLDNFGDGTAAVRLVAIAADQQGKGYGRLLDQQLCAYAQALGIKTIYVNAAPEAVNFYQKIDYTHFAWDPEQLKDIAADCIQMRKMLV